MKRLSLLILLFSFYFSSGQNLVPNPSFEDHTKCPREYSTCAKGYVKCWFQPSKGSADYFNACDKHNRVGVPRNDFGYCYAKSGQAYIGVYLYTKQTDYREYMSAKLLSPLVQGKKYKVQFYVSLAQISQYGTSDIQLLFSQDSIHKEYDSHIRIKPQLSYADSPVVAVGVWTKIAWTYTAVGNEQFITIGNFSKQGKCTLSSANEEVKRTSACAYYFIDDVCVSEIRADGSCTCDSVPKTDSLKLAVKTIDTTKPKLAIETNKSIVLQNISFETNKSQLLPPSFPELDELYNYLNAHSNTSIEISGYTDNTGDEQKNITLSEARAKAVADYLTGKGIDKSRITFKGYGSASPIADNKTEEGKAKNRRVEFKIH